MAEQTQNTEQVTEALQWGYSLANVSEIMNPCLDAAGVKTLLEIGSFRGELTEELLKWAEGSGAKIATVEPLPPADLIDLKKRRPELELIEDTGTGALEGLDSLPDAIIIDGDHNYFTLTQELEKIVTEEVTAACGQDIEARTLALESLRPGRPNPTYRYADVVNR